MAAGAGCPRPPGKLGPYFHRCFDGLENLLIAGAPAEIPREGFADLIAGRVRVLVEERLGRDEIAGRTVAALRGAEIGERFLQRVKPAVDGQSLDGRHAAPAAFDAEHEAGQDRPIVEQDRAGATFAQLAPVLGAAEVQILTQHLQQRLVRREGHLGGLVVDGQRDVSVLHRSCSSLRGPRPQRSTRRVPSGRGMSSSTGSGCTGPPARVLLAIPGSTVRAGCGKFTAWPGAARYGAIHSDSFVISAVPLSPSVSLGSLHIGSKMTAQNIRQRLQTGTAREVESNRPAARHAGKILGEEIGTIRRLVDDFSAFAKLPKVEPAPVDLGQVVEDFVRAHPEWQPFLIFTPPATPVGAEGDRMLIRRVLANLVENAVHAAEGAGRPPLVALSVAADAARGVATLIVDDNGPGIPSRERERVFDPYVTTKEHGTGLGLAIVRKIVIDHGGDVHAGAAPAPLSGARLTVTLPAAGARGHEAGGVGSPGGAPPA